MLNLYRAYRISSCGQVVKIRAVAHAIFAHHICTFNLHSFDIEPKLDKNLQEAFQDFPVSSFMPGPIGLLIRLRHQCLVAPLLHIINFNNLCFRVENETTLI